MSHVDSKDEEKARFLQPEKSNDSKESDNSKKEHEKQPYQKSDKTIEWETNDENTDDSEW